MKINVRKGILFKIVDYKHGWEFVVRNQRAEAKDKADVNETDLPFE